MSLDLGDLDGELSRTRRKFDQWASRLQEAALDTRQTHQQNMQDQSGWLFPLTLFSTMFLRPGIYSKLGKLQCLKARCQQLQEAAKNVKKRKSIKRKQSAECRC